MLSSFSVKDLIDILLVAAMLYQIYRLIRGTSSMYIFVGCLTFIVIWLVVSRVLDMRLLGSFLDKVVSVGAVALVIIFQEEVRRFLSALGSQQQWKQLSARILGHKAAAKNKDAIMPIVMACRSMSKSKTGALIIVEKAMPLTSVIRSGEPIDASINQLLIENIFFKNSPLHDGAMVVSHQRIKAAGCILPVSHQQDIPKSLGLRHRAALGMSEETDAVSIVVSEETGHIAVAHKGFFRLQVSLEELESILADEK